MRRGVVVEENQGDGVEKGNLIENLGGRELLDLLTRRDR